MKKPFPLVTLFFFLWLLCFLFSFTLPYLLEAKGDGFTKGLNRITALMAWQGMALLFALCALVAGLKTPPDQKPRKWQSRLPLFIQAALVFVIIGSCTVSRYINKPPANPNPLPPTKPAPAAPALNTPAEPPAELHTYHGIFRSGFETSHFYTTKGQGPWWAEFDEESWKALQAHHVDGPGRSGGITVGLEAEAWLDSDVSEIAHLGAFENRIHIVSIKSIRPLTTEEFQQLQTAFTRKP